MAQCPAHGSRVDEGQTSPLSRARSLYVENRVRLTARTCACRSTRTSAVRFRVLADEPIEKSLMRGSASPAQSTLFIGASPCPSPPSPLKLHRVSRKIRMSGVVRHPLGRPHSGVSGFAQGRAGGRMPFLGHRRDNWRHTRSASALRNLRPPTTLTRTRFERRRHGSSLDRADPDRIIRPAERGRGRCARPAH